MRRFWAQGLGALKLSPAALGAVMRDSSTYIGGAGGRY